MVIGPWGPLTLHKQSPAILGSLWFLAGLENPCQSVFSKENYNLVQEFNSELAELVQLMVFDIQS